MKFLGHIDEEKDIINLGEVGVAYMVILAPENFGLPEDVVAQAKTHNKVVFDAYAAAPEDAKPILYLSGSNRNTPLEVGTTVGESGQLASLDLSQKAVISMDAYKGEASVFLSATLYPDGSIALNSNNELGVEMVQLATTDYVDDVAGKAYPVYIPSDGQELTEEQKAANKEAYDVLAASYGGSQLPHLYVYDLGKMFPIIPYDVYADEGYAELFLNINMMQSLLSDFGLSGYGLLTLGEHFYLHSDGSVTADSSSMFISPDIMTMYELVNAKNVETRWLYVSLPGGSITATQQNYNKETVEKIANGGNVKLMIWPLYAPVSHVFADGGIVFTVALYNNDALMFGQGSVGPDGTYEYAEYTIGQGGSDDTITETDPVFSASAAAKITDADINKWNNASDSNITVDASMSDTSTNPVQNKTVKAYVDSKAATAGQMPTLAHGSSETSVEITPNVYHRWSSTMSSLTITLQSVSSAYVLNYMFEFKASSSGCVLTLPTNIKWANGNPPAIKPSATYQISIVNNLGVWTYYE